MSGGGRGRRLGTFGRARPAWFAWWVALGLLGAALGAAGGCGPGPAPGLTGVAAEANEVAVRVLQFGVGNRARPGDVAGVQVEILDRATTPRDLIVQLEQTDQDGDTALYQRLVPSSPGQRRPVWLYARLPHAATANTTFRISVHLAGENAMAGAPGEPGRLLGRLLHQQTSVIEDTNGAMAVIGREAARLDAYSVRMTPNEYLPYGHEVTEVVNGLGLANLPDRWLGWAMFDTLVWTAAPGEVDPSALGLSEAQAIREWVQRGGHLVVVLPTLGHATWLSPTNPLADLVPRVEVTREERADLRPLRPLLQRPPQPDTPPPPLPTEAVLHLMQPAAGAGPWDAMPILATADGRAVVSRRLVGAGRVSMVGLDITNKALLGGGAVQSDVFWHRVLGRRGQLPTAGVLAAREAQGGPDTAFLRATRRVATYDDFITDSINLTQQTAAGILLAFLVFGAFWVVGGPLGFALLKRQERTHWAWVGFVAVTGVFTALAWGGATALRPRAVTARHLTVVDYVHGQNLQHARSWMNVLLPQYGDMTVSVPLETPGDPYLNRISPWEPPAAFGGGASGYTFPDARAYAIDAARPDRARFPTRSTAKQVEIDWLGGPRWRMPLPAADAPVLLETTAAGARPWNLKGKLTHGLPGELKDVTVVVVTQPRIAPPAQLPATAQAFSVTGAWGPGVVLNLEDVTGVRGGTVFPAERWFAQTLQIQTEFGGLGTRSVGAGSEARALKALTFFPLLEPPDPVGAALSGSMLNRRRTMHGMDLAAWFTQPCVIVLGVLEGEASVVPLEADGAEAPTRGLTLVRWVHPLPPSPPRMEIPASRGAN